LSLPDTRKSNNYRKTIEKGIDGWFRSNNSYQPSFFKSISASSIATPSTAFPTRIGFGGWLKGP
jgi:hypothetical protein